MGLIANPGKDLNGTLVKNKQGLDLKLAQMREVSA